MNGYSSNHLKGVSMKNTSVENNEDTTWIVLLLVFGLAGIGGPILAIILFLVLYFWV